VAPPSCPPAPLLRTSLKLRSAFRTSPAGWRLCNEQCCRQLAHFAITSLGVVQAGASGAPVIFSQPYRLYSVPCRLHCDITTNRWWHLRHRLFSAASRGASTVTDFNLSATANMAHLRIQIFGLWSGTANGGDAASTAISRFCGRKYWRNSRFALVTRFVPRLLRPASGYRLELAASAPEYFGRWDVRWPSGINGHSKRLNTVH